MPFTTPRLFIGKGASAIEVVACSSDGPPRLPVVRSAWKTRHGNRAAPLLLVVLHSDKATLCGPTGDDPPTYPDGDFGQAERICREALEQPDRHAALRSLRDALPSVESRLPGIRNEGFLANHELAEGVHRSADWTARWESAGGKARDVIAQRGDALLRALGFKIEPIDQVTSVLRASENGQKLAVAILLKQDEAPELQADRFSSLSPVSYALAVADRENIPYVLISQGSKLRLYPAKVGVGVGRRGRTETYVEIHTGLLRDSDAAYLWLLFSADALKDGGTLSSLLEESKRFAGELAERLRDRIYGSVVPRLSEGIATARGLKKPLAKDLAETYEMAMTVLFRLLFVAYAEDKDLLPYKHNGLYQTRSLKRKAQELLELKRKAALEGTGEVPFDQASDSLWRECDAIFRAVEGGNRDWGVPGYDGGLFSRDAAVSPIGKAIADLSLANTVMGPVLSDLLCIETNAAEGWGPVDFRSLGVREFGTIYEGLLESELAVAETDLTVDREGYYRPCQKGEEPIVKKSRIYLHNRSGSRKATGSYFTKEFAVEHLLDHALEPALVDHLARLDDLPDDEAAERFFDFRVADLAMGSGHFLVAAVDRIERGLTGYLSKRGLSGVRRELATLRAAANTALDSLAEQVEIEDTQLLRRQIARRCIYGVDYNPVSVALARVSIWIHTFVSGLPLSLLDRTLVHGNSLVGVGTVKEIEDKAKEDDLPLFALDAVQLVGEALEPLKRLAKIADATNDDLRRARKAMAEAEEACNPARALCDIVTASRMKQEQLPVNLAKWEQIKGTIVGSRHHDAARKTIASLSPLHFPVAFPEVFLRERSGFDVVLGNPPWEEATLEEHAFWARHVPGLRGLNQRQQERQKATLRDERPDLVEAYERELADADAMRLALTTGPYPGMGTGDPDLYKAFCWRFWRLTPSAGGWVGVVLPRSAFNAKGSTEFRIEVFNHCDPADVTMVVNNRQWVFPEVHPQYTIGLVGVRHGESGKTVRLRGPFNSRERFDAGIHRPPSVFKSSEVLSWTDTASLPLLPSEESLDVFARMRQHPRLQLDQPGKWRARPHTELHATNDKKLMDLESKDKPRGFWPVFKGESFDLWEPDNGPGSYYAWADPKEVVPHLHKKAVKGINQSNSVWYGFDFKQVSKPELMPCYRPRVAFRDITRATDSRTVRVALLPPKCFVTNKGPYFIWQRGTPRDEAFLLGVLSSLPLDWYARRFVETGLNFFILNPFPIPRPPAESVLGRRVIEMAGRLAAIDDRYCEWAVEVGVECGPMKSAEKIDLIGELDAVVAHLYGLSDNHLIHVFETFHDGWKPGRPSDHPTLGDYSERLKATVGHYKEWTRIALPTAYQQLKPIIGIAGEGDTARQK